MPEKLMKYEQKDITTVQAPGLIAHGVNCQNAMGSGVAKALFTKWPGVKSEYHKFNNMILGAMQLVQIEPNLYVANCFTQEFYGRDGRRYANPDAIEEALDKVCTFVRGAIFMPKVIHLPPIGCGLGGLDFKADVAPVLQGLEGANDVTFVVCDNG